MAEALSLNRFRVVLSRPGIPGNIGAAARALKTMGLSRLYLVNPKHFPHPEAESRASGAVDVLANATVCNSLEEALTGVSMAAAFTARRRELSLPMQWAREAAGTLCEAANQGGDVALVFGNETYGLSNDELAICQLPVMIPTNPEYSSLNLGAAVQLMCYELRMAVVAPGEAPASFGELATVDEVEQMIGHFQQTMTASGFFNPDNPKRLLPRLRRMFGRIRLERDEVNILRGMLNSFQFPERFRKPD
ncbi:RNA methyltransferase [Uliginosibacterium sp. TH139]|uniref:RNA methyltransferase n=1 Tax=Uliginosibacterium sp. TH139 TaxID=2067453 RepID=UPI000C7A572E|nr:RNA methyltransferase [Uliginosibacterium sp. TH139]PLK47508.1 tRNA (cytosine(32)/uridine(32)-2'-O)-methyltransferase TrmJ [Uliginosibacterium sp. TH139]